MKVRVCRLRRGRTARGCEGGRGWRRTARGRVPGDGTGSCAGRGCGARHGVLAVAWQHVWWNVSATALGRAIKTDVSPEVKEQQHNNNTPLATHPSPFARRHTARMFSTYKTRRRWSTYLQLICGVNPRRCLYTMIESLSLALSLSHHDETRGKRSV